jgi:ComF family protein
MSGRALWSGLLELVLPRRCGACDLLLREGAPALGRPALRSLLCPACASSLPWLPEASCRLCQRALAPAPNATATLCNACMHRPSALDECTASVSFAGEVERWIHRFKYRAGGLSSLDPTGNTLARAFARDALARSPIPADSLVVPIPLHPRRLVERGFNPAAVLAREIAAISRARFAPRLLERIRDTPSQTGLDRRSRVRNVAGAFRCRREPAADTICLVDDVVTTGSTLDEAARTLRRSGASRILALCAARTPSTWTS